MHKQIYMVKISDVSLEIIHVYSWSFSQKTLTKQITNRDSAGNTGWRLKAAGFLDSYTHLLWPSADTWFHQRKPTSNLPVIFLTVQKSAHKSRSIIMKLLTNPTPSIPQIRYTTNADNRKIMWKKQAKGCWMRFFGWFSEPNSRTVSPVLMIRVHTVMQCIGLKNKHKIIYYKNQQQISLNIIFNIHQHLHMDQKMITQFYQ